MSKQNVGTGRTRPLPRPARRAEVRRARGWRDVLFILAAAVLLVLAVMGLVAGITFIAGGSLGSSPSNGNGGGSSTAGKALIAKARAEAATLVTNASSRSTQIVATARAQARRVKQHGGGHHGGGHRTHPGTPAATLAPTAAPVVPTTAPSIPAPTAVSTGIPNLPNVSPSDSIVWFNFDKAAGTVSVANRSNRVWNAQLVVTYYTANGTVAGTRTAAISHLAAKAIRTVFAGPPPAQWSNASAQITNVLPAS